MLLARAFRLPGGVARQVKAIDSNPHREVILDLVLKIVAADDLSAERAEISLRWATPRGQGCYAWQTALMDQFSRAAAKFTFDFCERHDTTFPVASIHTLTTCSSQAPDGPERRLGPQEREKGR
jgi:hypothetical protein